VGGIILKINIFGIPSCAGALYEGTEQASKAIRKIGLVEKLISHGFEVADYGDIDDYSNLPRHNISPVRNWPAPRIVWESIMDKSNQLFNTRGFSNFTPF
jgi:hypothetical protein